MKKGVSSNEYCNPNGSNARLKKKINTTIKNDMLNEAPIV